MGDDSKVHIITSVQEWEVKLEEGEKGKKVIVVDFTASWCDPCKKIAPSFAKLSKKHPGLLFLKVDVDQLPDVADKWDVESMPTFIFIQDKKSVHKIVGTDKNELDKACVIFSIDSATLGASDIAGYCASVPFDQPDYKVAAREPYSTVFMLPTYV